MRTSRWSSSGYSRGSTNRTSSASAPAYSTPVGSGADDAEREVAAAVVAVGFDHGALEAREHVVAQPQRLAEILQAEGLLLDAGVAVVVRGAPRREHERVVLEHVVVGEPDRLRGHVDVHDASLAVADVGRVAEQRAQRRRDLRRREQAARHLVQQRREEVIVAVVDDEHVDRLADECLGALQAAEPRADDHDLSTDGHDLNLRTRSSAGTRHAGWRGVDRKSVPIVCATGNSPACIHRSYGTPSTSATSRSRDQRERGPRGAEPA